MPRYSTRNKVYVGHCPFFAHLSDGWLLNVGAELGAPGKALEAARLVMPYHRDHGILFTLYDPARNRWLPSLELWTFQRCSKLAYDEATDVMREATRWGHLSPQWDPMALIDYGDHLVYQTDGVIVLASPSLEGHGLAVVKAPSGEHFWLTWERQGGIPTQISPALDYWRITRRAPELLDVVMEALESW